MVQEVIIFAFVAISFPLFGFLFFVCVCLFWGVEVNFPIMPCLEPKNHEN